MKNDMPTNGYIPRNNLLRLNQEETEKLKRLITSYLIEWVGSPWWLSGKEYSANVGDVGLIPGLGNPLEKELATHSNFLAWKIPWTEDPGRLHGVAIVRHDLKTKQQTLTTVESVIKKKKKSQQTKSNTRWLHRGILPNI